MAEAPSNPRSHNWGMVECGAVPVPNAAMQVTEEGSRVDSTWRYWGNREALCQDTIQLCTKHMQGKEDKRSVQTDLGDCARWCNLDLFLFPFIF